MSGSVVPGEGEHLTDGWEPELAPDDTLVRSCVLVHAEWLLASAAAGGRPSRRTDLWAGAHVGDRGMLTNPVILLRPLDDAPGVLAEIEELIPAATPYFLLSPFQTADLAAHGLVKIGHPPLMVRMPAPRPGGDPADVEVVEVVDEDTLAEAERVLVEGYPMPDVQPLVPGSVLPPALLGSSTHLWLARVDGAPVAVAMGYVGEAAVLVEYVATLSAARGRGAGAAVTWAATLAAPDFPAVLIASDDGRPVYERMGYLAIHRWTAWIRPT